MLTPVFRRAIAAAAIAMPAIDISRHSQQHHVFTLLCHIITPLFCFSFSFLR